MRSVSSYSISTSPNVRQHTTVLNADVPYCYTTPSCCLQ